MTITSKEIQHIADLAKVNLDKAELERYQGQLSAILDYVAKLQNVKDSVEEEATNEEPNLQRMRPDVVAESLTHQDLLRNSTNIEKKQFKLPPVFE